MQLHSKQILERLLSEPRFFLPFRQTGNRKAIIFLHGLDAKVAVWTPMAKLLMADPELAGWDMYSLGYRATLQPTLLWEGASLDNQSEQLYTNLVLPPVSEYESLAFVAHSAGGLVLQRALIDFDDVLQRTSHVFFFGTPSTGSHSARTWRFLNTGLRDMASGSRFVQRLRQDWKVKFPGDYPFHLELAAGDQDLYVRAASVHQPFPKIKLQVVQGDHDAMIKAESVKDPAYRIVKKGLQQPRPEVAKGETGYTSASPARPGKIFVSYSHEDADWHMSIMRVLRLALGRGSVNRVFDDTLIEAGELWPKRIEVELAQAMFAVLLVTPSFLASEFIRKQELPALLERQHMKSCRLFPITVSDIVETDPRLQDDARKLYRELKQVEFANEMKLPLAKVDSPLQGSELSRIADRIKSCIEGEDKQAS